VRLCVKILFARQVYTMNAHSTISRCCEEQFQLSKLPFSQCHYMRGSWVAKADWSSHFGHLHRALIGVNAFERGPQYRVPSRDFLYLSPYVFCTVTCHPLYFRALSKARPGNHDPFLDKPPFLVQAFTTSALRTHHFGCRTSSGT